MDAPEHEDRQFLGFHLAGEEYAVDVLRVRELIPHVAVTRVPTTPPWILGVINLRGSVVPVVDLAVKLALPPVEITPRTCIVIVETALRGTTAVMGILAEAVSRVLAAGPADIEPAPAFGTRVRVDCLRGMVKAGEKFVLLLDVDAVFAADEAPDLALPSAGAAALGPPTT